MLPPINADGRLPPGRHTTSWAEVHDVFVSQAPHTQYRKRIFQALRLYSAEVSDLLPGSRLWINGSFVTYKDVPPRDVDVAVVATAEHISAHPFERLAPLWTLQNVWTAQPNSYLRRLQPCCGLVDGFVLSDDETAALDFFDGLWQQVRDDDGASKGYLEVVTT